MTPNTGRLFRRSEVQKNREYERIFNLPRRQWTKEQMEQCASYYTEQLKTPAGKMHLRPLQAVALHEIKEVGGLFGPLRVGAGKTVVSLLAPLMVNAQRPILLLPAALIEKTRREMNVLMDHWKIPRNIQMVSYESLSRDGQAKFLEMAQPDLLICDEAHRLKNKKAGVTRRVSRYMHHFPRTMFIAISGTLIKDDIEDFAHLCHWALKENCPVPTEAGSLIAWSACLKSKVDLLNQVEPGPLKFLAPVEEECRDELTQARRAFRARLRLTPGVVASTDESVGCSLYVRSLVYECNQLTEENFHKLRASWETPDGWALSMAIDIRRHARELALGFHSIWDPRPPEEWLEKRRIWAKFVRNVLSHSKSLDTEYQVQQAYATSDEWTDWVEIEPTFIIQPKDVWHDHSALEACHAWGGNGPGIIWTEHNFFARELARGTGFRYFGEQGTDDDGRPIEGADPKETVIASIRANSTGRNLQMWSRNLVTSPMTSAPAWEQLIGRTHRDGQVADTVTVDFLMGCTEHRSAVLRAVDNAIANKDTTGEGQKLLLSDLFIQDSPGGSSRWEK